MANQRQSFSFRLWPTRRNTTTQMAPPAAADSPPSARATHQSQHASRQITNTTHSPPPSTTNSTPAARPSLQSRPVNRQLTTSKPTLATQTPSQPPGTTNPATISTTAVETQAGGRQPTANPTSTNPTIGTQTPSQPPTTATSPTPTSEPHAEHNPSSTPSNTPLLNEIRATSSPPLTPQINPKGEPKTLSPSSSTKRASPMKLASSARRQNQSKPPPQPSSPPHPAGKAPPSTNSPSSPRDSKAASTAQRAIPHSISRWTCKRTPSNSPKRPLNSPSTESKLIAPQEPGRKAEGKSNSGKSAFNDKNVSIITLAGENRGASMQMGSTSLKDWPVQIRRGYRSNSDETAGKINDREEITKGEQFEVAEATGTEAFVNNNTQGINNSIVFNASIAEKNSGVHLAVTRAPKDPIAPKKYKMSRAEKVTCTPSVRRRCLRGLFLETSGSDCKSTEKPRRHGCRVGFRWTEKENNPNAS